MSHKRLQIAKSVGILSRTRFYLSCKTKLMLYYTLIYPYITCCTSTLSSSYVSNLNRIYYLQRRAVRAVTSSDYRAHTAPLFSKVKILDIFQINALDIAKFMFRYITIICCLHFHSICLSKTVKSIDMTQEQSRAFLSHEHHEIHNSSPRTLGLEQSTCLYCHFVKLSYL